MPSQDPLFGGEKPAKPKKAEATLGEAMVKKLTGRTAGFAGRLAKKALPDRAAWVEKQQRGKTPREKEKAAAAAAGVSLTTWRRWKSGAQKAGAKGLEKLDRATREAMIPKGRRERLAKSTGAGTGTRAKRPTGGASIHAWVRVSSDERPRELNLGGNLPPGRMEALAAAYAEGGEEAMREELDQIIRQYLGGGGVGFGGDFEITQIISINLDPIQDSE